MTAPDRFAALRLFVRGRLRIAGTLALLAALAACATVPKQDAIQESAHYAAHAQHGYTPPGPPEDPWGPYIREASARFDLPDTWIRALMRVESGGEEYQNGKLTTSGAGAMGLMQVMPSTYDELRDRYNLGDDPYSPHDNIMAGVAYMREMYELYGSPGFLAAYNAGPSRLDDYLANVRPLPDETRRYVAMIAPHLQGIFPNNRSAADQMALNALPINIPPGRRYGRPTMLASARRPSGGHLPRHVAVEVAQLPEPARRGGDRQEFVQTAANSDMPLPPRHGFHLIASANAADTAPARHGAPSRGEWAIQIGAFGNKNQAHAALVSVQTHARAELAVAHPIVASVRQGRNTLWRARMTGMSRDTAMEACSKITHGRSNCIVLSPDAQS
jgi:hypothetical protein